MFGKMNKMSIQAKYRDFMKKGTSLSVCFATLACAAIVFGIIGRIAIRQITDHNLTSIETVTAELATNSPPDSHPDYNKIERQLSMRVALSATRQDWTTAYTCIILCGVLSGIAAFAFYRRLKNGKLP